MCSRSWSSRCAPSEGSGSAAENEVRSRGRGWEWGILPVAKATGLRTRKSNCPFLELLTLRRLINLRYFTRTNRQIFHTSCRRRFKGPLPSCRSYFEIFCSTSRRYRALSAGNVDDCDDDGDLVVGPLGLVQQVGHNAVPGVHRARRHDEQGRRRRRSEQRQSLHTRSLHLLR